MMAEFIGNAWKRHLEGKLGLEGAELKRFTRKELSIQMAALFDRYRK